MRKHRQAYDEKEDIKRLVNQLEELRKEHDLTRYKLLWKSDTSPNVLDNWINHGIDPRVGTMSRVLQVMGYELTITKKESEEIRNG